MSFAKQELLRATVPGLEPSSTIEKDFLASVNFAVEHLHSDAASRRTCSTSWIGASDSRAFAGSIPADCKTARPAMI